LVRSDETTAMNNLFLKPICSTRGDAKLNLIIAIVVVVGIVYVVIKAAPIWIDHYSLKDEIEQLAIASQCRNLERVKQEILNRIKGFSNTTVKEDQVIVKCDSDKVKVQVDYRRRLELPGYSRTFSFNVNEDIRTFR